MKKTKMEQGITLIALIITIVVLLILAVVSIGAINESKIIKHAQNASTTYITKQNEENQILQEALDYIEDKTTKKIDDDTIMKMLDEIIFYGDGDAEKYNNSVQKLKNELSIEGTDIRLEDILCAVAKDSGLYVYIYKINRMYKADDNGSSIVGYIKEEENQDLYDYARSIKLVKEELEKVFIGKTETEVKQKITDGKFNEFLQANSDIIISAEGVRCYPEPNGIDIDSITFKNGDKEQTLSGDTDNYSIEIYLKNGTFYKVNVSYGT